MVKIRGCNPDGIMAMGPHYGTLQPGVRGLNYQCDWLRGDGIRTEFYMLRPLSLQIFNHSVFCLTTGPKPPPKRCLHIVRSRASSFK